MEALVSSSAFFLRCGHSHQDAARNRTCVTPQMLGRISSYGVQRVAGFSSLRADDQACVRLALKRRRVDPVDLIGPSPSSSKPMSQPSQVSATQPTAASSKKRKAEDTLEPSESQNVVAPSPTQAATRQAAIGGTAWEEGADAEEVLDQQIDELYCTTSSNVVGIQYYKGVLHHLIPSHTRAFTNILHGRSC